MIGYSDFRESIVAIASATSPALGGIVRITGDDALEVLGRMSSHPFKVAHRPVVIHLALQLAEPLGLVDCRAFVWPTSRSYTGTPSVEIHTFGSLPILEAVVAAAVHAGARPAGPGEFTMRAFLGGQLDLTQAEAVLGVIDAKSQKQLDSALTQLAGNISSPLRQARNQLLDLLADLEAGLDFVEEDISFIDDRSLLDGLQSISVLLRSTAAKMTVQRRSESFHWVVLRGCPNAGKSSLLNALTKQSIAIVSDQAGTTRDVVWKELKLGDYLVRLADTAGIEERAEEIVTASQQVANEMLSHASLILHCTDARDITIEEKTEHDPDQAKISIPTITIATKCDTVTTDQCTILRKTGWLVTSSITGDGLAILSDEIAKKLSAELDSFDGGVPGTAIRCTDAVKRAASSIQLAIHFVSMGTGHELVAAEMRQTLGAIGEITGEIYTDDILDRVFSRFCIGK